MKPDDTSVRRKGGLYTLPILVLLFSLALTAAITAYVAHVTRANNRAHFASAARQVDTTIGEHLATFSTLLQGTAALFAADKQVSEQEFHGYVQRLLASGSYRGLQGIGFARRVTKAELPSYIQARRAQGLTNFNVFPDGERAEYFPIQYLEPPDRPNVAAIGYDMSSEPTRRAAMASAITNAIDATGKVTLVQEIFTNKQPGFLIYVAVYRGVEIPPDSDARKRNLVGFVYSPFRANDFFNAMFPPESDTPVHIDVYDGNGVDATKLLHQSATPAAISPVFSTTKTIPVAHHSWTVVIQSTPQFEETLQNRTVPSVLGVGIAISFALFGTTVYFNKARLIRRRDEEALRASEELYRTTTDSAADAIILIDENSNILSVNRSTERIFGYSKKELIHQPLTLLMPERFRHRHRDGLRNYLKTSRKHIPWGGVELPGLHKDGHEIPLEISFGEVMQNGKHIFAGIVRDITERKQVERSLRESEERYRTFNEELEKRVRARTDELAASNQELEAFTYSVAHDLRAPLRHMNAFAQMIKEDAGAPLPPTLTVYIEKIAESASRMSRLVDGLLNLSVLGKTPLELQLTPLRPIVDKVVASYVEETKRRHIEWIVEELPSIECDPGLITGAITNLIANAVKYTRDREHPMIRIGMREVNKEAAMFVADNGVGFNMQYAGKLFGIFEKLETTDERGGTGIGLAMASRIIHKHRGRIWAESVEGKGATFYFTIPGMNKAAGISSPKQTEERHVYV